jgi:hypothetical protein
MFPPHAEHLASPIYNTKLKTSSKLSLKLKQNQEFCGINALRYKNIAQKLMLVPKKQMRMRKLFLFFKKLFYKNISTLCIKHIYWLTKLFPIFSPKKGNFFGTQLPICDELIKLISKSKKIFISLLFESYQKALFLGFDGCLLI